MATLFSVTTPKLHFIVELWSSLKLKQKNITVRSLLNILTAFSCFIRCEMPETKFGVNP